MSVKVKASLSAGTALLSASNTAPVPAPISSTRNARPAGKASTAALSAETTMAFSIRANGGSA